MKLIDKYGMIYYPKKKGDNYYLCVKRYSQVYKGMTYVVEVKGKENIDHFIRNNHLVKYEEKDEKLHNRETN